MNHQIEEMFLEMFTTFDLPPDTTKVSKSKFPSVICIPLFFVKYYISYNLLHIAELLTYQLIFDAVDVNKDGFLSLEEYSYAFMSFFFHSGPDDPISLFFGNLVDLLK